MFLVSLNLVISFEFTISLVSISYIFVITSSHTGDVRTLSTHGLRLVDLILFVCILCSTFISVVLFVLRFCCFLLLLLFVLSISLPHGFKEVHCFLFKVQKGLRDPYPTPSLPIFLHSKSVFLRHPDNGQPIGRHSRFLSKSRSMSQTSNILNLNIFLGGWIGYLFFVFLDISTSTLSMNST